MGQSPHKTLPHQARAPFHAAPNSFTGILAASAIFFCIAAFLALPKVIK